MLGNALRLGSIVLLAAVLAGAKASGAERLMWHDVRLDGESKLLSWAQASEGPYGLIIRKAWEAFKNIPVQSDGYRTYFTHPTFYGPNDPAHAQFSGRPWVHHPAGLFAMLTDSAILYHAYSGDRVILERAREMLDYMIAHERLRPVTPGHWCRIPVPTRGSLSIAARTTRSIATRKTIPLAGEATGWGFWSRTRSGS